ncbi:zinc-binding alcohol dehydrogenase family protein [Paenibacillus aceris]|uniref:2-desacetyl-2-hydroxyethyl bacteriochlorophyllide A dehydrogenase n=1 Tax=Paenibacillus aceris TaxID=869555 RepID=A0ABS4HXX4_9BACL|nr:zinc-binding alcohol dehydrogenase family protein [Paenibacillus aceris]MBP1963191.1 2-desacetyl-2-hydroxyethyl bacteriochlorophyllide A dehydrogenase [Paenibacillus aceris]NHW38692.1 zinc-binding alcohol dehydrogenase family protein [Paenibacillus aceris]
MKTIVCDKPNEFIWKQKSKTLKKQGEALVQIRRIGICGTDYHAFRGEQAYFEYPRVLGHELAGVIEEVEDNEYDFKVGDQVSIIPYMYCGSCIACRNGKTNCCTDMKVLGVHIDGGMQEYMSVPLSALIKTNELSLDQSVILEPIAIGAHAVRRAEIREGETVAVLGAGPIGLGVMAIAKGRGAKVIAMDVNESRLEFCRSWANVDSTVNVMNQPYETLLQLTGGDLPTVVLDATGNVRSMTDAFRYVSHGGRLVYVGLVKSDITFSDPEFHKKELTLLSSRNATKEDFGVVMDAIQSGAVDASRFITHRSSFETMIDGFESWLRPESKVIKAIVEL